MITTIGPHRVQCGNILNGIDLLMNGEQADVFYSDPPWGQGNIAFWQTLNHKDTGAAKQQISLQQFLGKFFSIIQNYAKNLVMIEYGRQWDDHVLGYAKNIGLLYHGTAVLVYKSGSQLLPMHLHVFSKKPIEIPPDFFKSVAGTHGMATLRAAVKPFAVPGGIILDPCCGMGYCAQIALETGMRFRGNELNAKRLQKTIDRLKKGDTK